MSSPSGVGNGDLRNKGLFLVDRGLLDGFAKASNLANMLERKYFVRLVTIDTDALPP
jgi:hypothetical protein